MILYVENRKYCVPCSITMFFFKLHVHLVYHRVPHISLVMQPTLSLIKSSCWPTVVLALVHVYRQGLIDASCRA